MNSSLYDNDYTQPADENFMDDTVSIVEHPKLEIEKPEDENAD